MDSCYLLAEVKYSDSPSANKRFLGTISKKVTGVVLLDIYQSLWLKTDYLDIAIHGSWVQ